jgi:hypothetical protein
MPALKKRRLFPLFPLHGAGADLAPPKGIQGKGGIDPHKLRRRGAMLEILGIALFFEALLFDGGGIALSAAEGAGNDESPRRGIPLIQIQRATPLGLF